MKTYKSIYEIAEAVGVSHATVSRVLNGSPHVSDKTREAVLKLANEGNFKTKLSARQTKVAFLVNYDDHLREARSGYLDVITIALIDALSHREVAIEFFTQHNLNRLNPHQISGIIAMPWREDVNDILREFLPLPIVLVNAAPVEGMSSVACDHFKSGRMAAEYLLSRGCKRCCICLDTLDWGNRLRLDGFEQTLKQNGLSLPQAAVGIISQSSEVTMFQRILQCEPDGFFLGIENKLPHYTNLLRELAGNDRYSAMQRISMENPSTSRYLEPPVSGLLQPLNTLMNQAVKLLFDHIENGQLPPENHLLFDTELIQRIF